MSSELTLLSEAINAYFAFMFGFLGMYCFGVYIITRSARFMQAAKPHVFWDGVLPTITIGLFFITAFCLSGAGFGIF